MNSNAEINGFYSLLSKRKAESVILQNNTPGFFEIVLCLNNCGFTDSVFHVAVRHFRFTLSSFECEQIFQYGLG